MHKKHVAKHLVGRSKEKALVPVNKGKADNRKVLSGRKPMKPKVGRPNLPKLQR